MNLQTLIIAMSIPSGVTAFCFWVIEQKIKKQQTEAEEKEKIREKNEVLIIKSVMASIALGESAATALKNGHANGETEAALEYAGAGHKRDLRIIRTNKPSGFWKYKKGEKTT